MWLEHMEQQERGGQKVGRDGTIYGLVGNGKEFGFYTKYENTRVAGNAQPDLGFTNISLAAL